MQNDEQQDEEEKEGEVGVEVVERALAGWNESGVVLQSVEGNRQNDKLIVCHRTRGRKKVQRHAGRLWGDGVLCTTWMGSVAQATHHSAAECRYRHTGR